MINTQFNATKRDTFDMMAEIYNKLATDLEKIAAANALVDGERERRLIGMLSDEDDAASNMAEIAKLLVQIPDKARPHTQQKSRVPLASAPLSDDLL